MQGQECPEGLTRLREKLGPAGERHPQGLKPNVLVIVFGPTKVVP
jgi:hypothetical protein